MKKIVLFLVMLISIFPISGFTNRPLSITTGEQKIEIAFTQSTGFTELVMIREQLAKKHIVLSYRKIEYNDEGKLKAISFRVDCQDGFSGSAATDNLSEKRKFGFFRDYTANASTPFGTGSF